MKVAFVNGPTEKFKVSRDSRWPERSKSETIYYPLWLAYAAGVAKQEGFDVLLVDAEASGMSLEETCRKLEKFKPDLLVVNTTTPTFDKDIENVGRLAELEAKIVMVGTHVSAMPDSAFKTSKDVDFVARGEYDFTIVELARNLNKPRKVKGISYRGRGGKVKHNPPAELVEDLDRIPWVSPIYQEFLKLDDYAYALAQKPMVQIFSGRGCPNRCVFCQYPQVFSGRKFRKRSVKDFVDELEWIAENMPEVREIFVEDDTFTIDKKRVEGICDEIIKRGLKVRWSANVRADLRLDLMKKMKEAGCRLLVVGYESGNDGVLKKAKKGITTAVSRQFAEDAKEAGLKVFGCFMLGLPGETRESMEDTYRFALEVEPDMVFFQQAVPFPGTEMFEWAKGEGYLRSEDFRDWYDREGYFDFVLDYPELTAEEIREARDRFMKGFYTRPKFVVRTVLRSLTDPGELARVFRGGVAYLRWMLRGRD